MDIRFYNEIESNPVIAAVKDVEGLHKAVKIDSIRIIFILFGDICNISEIVNEIKENNKVAMVHIDLIGGLSSKDISVDFIKQSTKADGIITTKPNLIKRAKELSLYTVLRFFLIDSMAFENVFKSQNNVTPDVIEILPGVMPKIIKKISKKVKCPLIAGGLIRDKEDIMEALSSGAVCVSSTNQDTWVM
ncbi:glycerol-3-phosphate responsive antiterminator [Intestinibacter sp.]